MKKTTEKKTASIHDDTDASLIPERKTVDVPGTKTANPARKEEEKRAKEEAERLKREREAAERKRWEDARAAEEAKKREIRETIRFLIIAFAIYAAVTVGQVFLLKGTWQIVAPNWLLKHSVKLYHWQGWYDSAPGPIIGLLSLPVELVVWMLGIITYPLRWLLSRLLGLVFYLLYFVAPLIPSAIATPILVEETDISINPTIVGRIATIFVLLSGLVIGIVCWVVLYPVAFASIK